MTFVILRRWLQFSLRILLLFMAFTCPVFAWVGYSLDWIKQRRLFLVSINYQPMEACGFSGGGVWPEATAPGGLGLFGETGVPGVIFWHDGVSCSLNETKRLFPEATIIDRTHWAKLTEQRRSLRARQSKNRGHRVEARSASESLRVLEYTTFRCQSLHRTIQARFFTPYALQSWAWTPSCFCSFYVECSGQAFG
jgi:hypothetical protein